MDPRAREEHGGMLVDGEFARPVLALLARYGMRASVAPLLDVWEQRAAVRADVLLHRLDFARGLGRQHLTHGAVVAHGLEGLDRNSPVRSHDGIHRPAAFPADPSRGERREELSDVLGHLTDAPAPFVYEPDIGPSSAGNRFFLHALDPGEGRRVGALGLSVRYPRTEVDH